MFRKLILYIAVFVFTTGFLKSDLEKCANYWFEKQPNSNLFPTAIYDKIERTREEIKKIREERNKKTEKAIKRYKSLPFCKGATHGFFNKFDPNCRIDRKKYSSGKSYEELLRRMNEISAKTDNFKTVKIRDIPEKDIKMLRTKFLNKSLKKKLNQADTNNAETMASKKYNQLYVDCIDEKKNNLELFKAKY